MTKFEKFLADNKITFNGDIHEKILNTVIDVESDFGITSHRLGFNSIDLYGVFENTTIKDFLTLSAKNLAQTLGGKVVSVSRV